MLLLSLFVALEIVVNVYDFFNPSCDFLTNEVSKNLEYDQKKQICDTWEKALRYDDPVTGISSQVPNQHFPNLNINNHGFRGPEILKEKAENTFRIFVVGGSTTFSLRTLSDQTTIPGYLQENFDNFQLNKKIEVINAGITNIVSTDELKLIQTKIVQFKPDLIIIYDGTNDLTNPYLWIKPKENDDLLMHIHGNYFNFYKTPYVINNIINTKIPKIHSESDWEDKALLWKKNMISICELGRQHGYETVVILQPILGSGNKILTDQERKNFEFNDQAKFVIGYNKFADKLKDLDDYCVKIFDFRDIFDDMEETAYFDRAHVGSASNKIIAAKIFELIHPLVN